MTASRAAMSFAGAVGFGQETTYGTAASITDWIAAESATPSVKRAQQPWPLITYDWEAVASVPGLLEVGVSIAFNVYNAGAISNLLSAATYRVPFGASSGTIAQPHSYTIELVMDNGSSIRLVGCVANSLSLSVKPSDIVKGTVEFQAVNASVVSSSTPSVSLGAMYHGSNTAVTFGGTANVLCNSFDVNLANNCSRRYTFTGGPQARRVRAANQLVKGNFQFDFEDTTQFENFLGGVDQAVAVTIAGSDGSALEFDLPVVRYEGDDPALNGANIVEDKIPFMAVKSQVAGHAFTVAIND